MLNPSRRRASAAAVAALAFFALVLTGCSSSSTSSTTTTLSVASSVRKLCNLVSSADIQQALDVTVKAPQNAISSIAVTCTYPAPDPADSVIVKYISDVSESEFNAQLKRAETEHPPVYPVTGIGSGAYYISATTPTGKATSLLVLHGQAEINVTSSAPAANLESLARLILYRLETTAH
jgi:hypothetical protein